MHVIVVGAGFGGSKAALELARRGIKVTLISDESYFLHHATLYATATGRARAESVVPLAEMFENHKNVTIVQDKIKSIDSNRRLAVGQSKSYRYDKLVLAIGVVTTYFGIEGLAQHSYGIKTLKEVKKFKKHLHDEMTKKHSFDKNYFVIGAGPTGVELAGALAEYLNHIAVNHKVKSKKPRIVLVEAAERILPRASKTASKKVHSQLEKIGVKVLTKKAVRSLDDDNIDIAGRFFPTHTAVWTSGVANHPFFERHKDIFELAPNGRVLVDPYMQAARHIYVIGDNAATPFSGQARTALNDAKFIARYLARVKNKLPLSPARHRKPPLGVPVGEKFAYVEYAGIYAAGRFGSLLRRLLELSGYMELLPYKKAHTAWKSHGIYEETCLVCKKANKSML